MQHLSININNRKKHVLKLVSGTATQAVPFVVQRENQVNVLLFSVSIHAKLLARAGYDFDTYIDWSSLQVQSSENELVLSLKSSKQVITNIKTESLPKVEGLNIIYRNGEVFFNLEPNRKSTHIKVILKVETEKSTPIHGEFLLHLASKSQIFDVVMDFGSEASQVVVYRRSNENHILTRLKLLDILTEYYYPNLKGKALHQTVVEDTELYRSAFFVKKENSVFDMYGKPGQNGENEFLNLLTNREDIDRLSLTHFLVSNLKLAHLGAYNFEVSFESTKTNTFEAQRKNFIDTISKLQQGVINYILQVVLKYLRDSNRENRPIYLAVRLLVPNVFDQNKVSNLVRRTLEGLEKIKENTPELLLAGNEVNTISESDASFLGFKRLKENENLTNKAGFFVIGKRYLIIDVGKGTTDYSIIEINKSDLGLTSLYRSGFIGAGNVISYAFIDTIFAAIFGGDSISRKQAIFDICLSPVAGLADKLRFVELVEVLKRNYDNEIENTKYKPLAQLIPNELDIIRDEYKQNPKTAGILERISKALEIVIAQQGSLKDEFMIIHDSVAKMVNRMVKEVYQTGYYTDEWIDKIILTGRGFRFEMLVEQIQKDFNKTTIKSDDLKKVCLSGAFSGERINYDSNLVGKPTIYQVLSKATEKEKVKEVDLGANLPKINLPTFGRLNDLNKAFTAVKNTWAKFNASFEDELTGEDPYAKETILTSRNELDFSFSPEEKLFLEGTVFTDFNPNAKTVNISGIDYKKHDINSPTVNLCYTGEEFLIREATNSSTLEVIPDFFKSDPYVFQTLFPFAEVALAKEVVVQKLQD